ncbi:MAG: threonine synthase, partial [Chloroflexota bacterium]
GVVEEVSDQEIMDAKALIDRQGLGCEPASACSLVGVQKLVRKGIIKPHETVVGILTGHVLKDADAVLQYHSDTLEGVHPRYANKLYQSEATIEALSNILEVKEAEPA